MKGKLLLIYATYPTVAYLLNQMQLRSNKLLLQHCVVC